MSQKNKRRSRSHLSWGTAVGRRQNGMRYAPMEALESRILLSYTFLMSGSTATVTPVAATGGPLLIGEIFAFGSPVLEHSEDGGVNFSVDWDDSTAGIQFLAAATTSTVNLTPTTGAGSSITIGEDISAASNILASIHIGSVSNPANVSLTIDDSTSVRAAGSYDFYSTVGTITGPGGAAGGINVTLLEPVNSNTILGGTSNNTFNIHSTFNATTTSNTIVGGGGDDVVNVLGDTSPGIGTPLTIDMQGGSNTVNIGSGNSLSAISSTVVVTETGGTTALTLNGQNDTGHASATLDSLSGNVSAPFEITGLSSGTIEYGAGVTAVNVNGGTNGGSGITYNINNTQSGTTTTLTGGANQNTFNLSNSGLTGGLDNLPGAVVVHGGSSGTDAVTLEDSSADFNDTYTVTDTTVTRTVFGGLTYDGIGTLTLNAENTLDTNGNNTININNTAAGVTTNINGQGGVDTITVNGTASSGSLNITTGIDDGSTVNVVANATVTNITMNGEGTVNIGSTGSAGTMAGILGGISVNDPPSLIALNFHDENDTTGQTWTLDNDDVGSTGSVAVTGLGTTSYIPDDLGSLTINGGSGGNTFTVNNTSGFFVTTLNTGTGNDTVGVFATGNNTLNIHGQSGFDTVSLGGLASVGMQSLTGVINVTNTDGFNTLTLDDSQNSSANIATLADDGTTSTVTGLAPATINITDNDARSITVDGSSGGDIFNVGGNKVGLTLTGGAGVNVLNYDAQAQMPAVNRGNISGEIVTSLAHFGDVDSFGYGTVNYTDIATAITPGTAVSLNNLTGVQTNLTVGTFTLPLPQFGTPPTGFPASDFTATLGWGDGSLPQAATITADASNPIVYSLSAAHTFATKGNFTISNSISFIGDSYSTALNGVTMNVTLLALGPTAGNSATVSSAPTTTALSIANQPRNGVAGVALGKIVIDVRTLLGAINKLDSSNVTLSVASGPGVLSGTVTVAAVHGIATFTNVLIDTVGSYTLKISANGASVISKSVVITPGAVASLAFGALPTTAEAGEAIGPAIIVKAFDAFGNPVNKGRVNMAIATGPAGSKLNGWGSTAIVNGVAIFNNLQLRTAGSYTLLASSNGVTMTSGSFVIFPAAASKVVFLSVPATVTAGNPITGTITVLVEDQYGNLTTNTEGTVVLTMQSNKHHVALGGTTEVTLVNGQATFDDLDVATAGSYTIVASFDGFSRSHKLVVIAAP